MRRRCARCSAAAAAIPTSWAPNCARTSRPTRRSCDEGEEREVQPTLGFQRVLQRAVFHVQSSGRKEVGVVNVLVAIFSEKQSHAVFLLSAAEHHASGRRALHLARPGARAMPSPRADETRHRGRRARSRGRQRAGQVRDQPERAGAGRAHRSADRARAGGRAHDRDPVPPSQEQSARTWARPASARPRSPKAWRG